MALITMDEAIDWGRRGELCDLMTDADQRQVAEWLGDNAKLQKLCGDLLARDSVQCERCGYSERCRAHETTCYTAGIDMRKRARELGVD